MGPGMRVVPYEEVRAVATPGRIVEAVRVGFMAHASGRVRQALTSHLAFAGDGGARAGDCHVKWGHDEASTYFVIKVATSFYSNPQHGLPSSNGLVLLMSAQTGEPVALLEDRGWLTDARTAAAGVLASEAAGIERIDTLGVLGTGIQAGLQARWIAAHRQVSRVLVWGRRPGAAGQLVADLRASGIESAVAERVSDLATQSDLIVTTTPSFTPLLMNSDVKDGTAIVAIGADARGKRELDRALLHRADRIICDDPAQCLDHGELQDSGIDAGRLERIGELLLKSETKGASRAAGVTIVDLTGIATQDVAAAQACWLALSRSDDWR